MERYEYFIRALLGFLRGHGDLSLNVVTGKDKLDSAFKVFEDAKVQAQDAISILQSEQDSIQLDIKVLEEEYQAKMKEKVSLNDEVMLQKAKASAFISKVEKIIG